MLSHLFVESTYGLNPYLCCPSLYGPFAERLGNSEEEQAAKVKARLKNYAHKVYKKTKVLALGHWDTHARVKSTKGDRERKPIVYPITEDHRYPIQEHTRYPYKITKVPTR